MCYQSDIPQPRLPQWAGIAIAFGFIVCLVGATVFALGMA